MTILTSPLPNSVATTSRGGAADFIDPGVVESKSRQKFKDAMTREEAMYSQSEALGGLDNVSGVRSLDVGRHTDSFFLAQSSPAQSFGGSNVKGIDITTGIGALPTPVLDAAVVEPGTPGQGIIDGLSRLRGVFDAQEQAITSVAPTFAEGGRVFKSSELINLQLEVFNYTLLADVSAKLAGKTTATVDTLMKGQ